MIDVVLVIGRSNPEGVCYGRDLQTIENHLNQFENGVRDLETNEKSNPATPKTNSSSKTSNKSSKLAEFQFLEVGTASQKLWVAEVLAPSAEKFGIQINFTEKDGGKLNMQGDPNEIELFKMTPLYAQFEHLHKTTLIFKMRSTLVALVKHFLLNKVQEICKITNCVHSNSNKSILITGSKEDCVKALKQIDESTKTIPHKTNNLPAPITTQDIKNNLKQFEAIAAKFKPDLWVDLDFGNINAVICYGSDINAIDTHFSQFATELTRAFATTKVDTNPSQPKLKSGVKVMIKNVQVLQVLKKHHQRFLEPLNSLETKYFIFIIHSLPFEKILTFFYPKDVYLTRKGNVCNVK